MHTITRRDRIKGIAIRIRARFLKPSAGNLPSWEMWPAHFGRGKAPGSRHEIRANIMYDKVMNLDLATCSRKVVDEVLGTDGYTKITCVNCRKDVPVAIRMNVKGREIQLCKDCIAEAADKIEARLPDVMVEEV